MGLVYAINIDELNIGFQPLSEYYILDIDRLKTYISLALSEENNKGLEAFRQWDGKIVK